MSPVPDKYNAKSVGKPKDPAPNGLGKLPEVTPLTSAPGQKGAGVNCIPTVAGQKGAGITSTLPAPGHKAAGITNMPTDPGQKMVGESNIPPAPGHRGATVTNIPSAPGEKGAGIPTIPPAPCQKAGRMSVPATTGQKSGGVTTLPRAPGQKDAVVAKVQVKPQMKNPPKPVVLMTIPKAPQKLPESPSYRVPAVSKANKEASEGESRCDRTDSSDGTSTLELLKMMRTDNQPQPPEYDGSAKKARMLAATVAAVTLVLCLTTVCIAIALLAGLVLDEGSDDQSADAEWVGNVTQASVLFKPTLPLERKANDTDDIYHPTKTLQGLYYSESPSPEVGE